ncbi:hypothetical protein P7K49_036670, partial [Saguinus oedipus]
PLPAPEGRLWRRSGRAARGTLVAEEGGRAGAGEPEEEELGLKAPGNRYRCRCFRVTGSQAWRPCVAMPELAVQKVVVHPLVLLSVVDHFNR